ncbi:Arc family DNA-binding protein [Aeromonas veronii]
MLQQTITPFGVRMDESLKEALKRRAKSNGRSLNQEVIQILREKLKDEGMVVDTQK